MIMIEADFDNKVISAGKFKCDELLFFKKWDSPNYDIILGEIVPWFPGNLGMKKKAQLLTEKLGISPSRWVKIWNGKMYSMWIEPHEKVIKSFCRGYKGKYNFEWTKSVHTNAHLVEQALEDGNENLIPFILVYGMPPQTLEKMFGEELWSNICANSKTRNRLICLKAKQYNIFDIRRPLLIQKDIRFLNEFPSTVLKYSFARYDEACLWASKNVSRLSDKDKIVSLAYLCAGTEMASHSLNKQIDYNWSERTMKEAYIEMKEKIKNKARIPYHKVGAHS